MTDRPDNKQPNADHDWILSDTGKWYYYLEPGIRMYESGTKYQEGTDGKRGHIIAAPPDAIYTSENAAEMQSRMIESRREDVIRGMEARLVEKGRIKAGSIAQSSVREAFGAAVVDHAFDKLTPGSAQVKRLAAELLDVLPDKRKLELQDSAGNKASGSPDQLAELLSALQAKREQLSDNAG